jgi:hypothetical protein
VLAPLEAFYPELPEGVVAHHERGMAKDTRASSKDGEFRCPRASSRLPTRSTPLRTVAAIASSVHPRAHVTSSLAGRGTEFDPHLVDLFILPPVFKQIADTQARVERWRVPVKARKMGEPERQVPDVTFRWRPETKEERARPAQDRQRRKAR